MESEGIQGTMGFTTVPPGRTTTKLSPTLFCLYVQVKPYCNLWSFCLPNDEKTSLTQQLPSLFQAVLDTKKDNKCFSVLER